MAESAYDYVVPIELLGAPGCGKTNIVSRYVKDTFSSEHIPSSRILRHDDIYITNDVKRACLKIKESSLVPKTELFIVTGILVYDITSEASFQEARILLEGNYLKTMLKCVLVGNKIDKADERKVNRERGKQLAIRHNLQFMEISAKTGDNVGLLFDTMMNLLSIKERARQMRLSPRMQELLFGENWQLHSPPPVGTASDHKVLEEFQQDPFAADLYIQALSEGEENDCSIRVNIVGNYRQGKTSLMKQMTGMEMKDIKSTNGIDIGHLVCYRTVDGKLSFRKATSNDLTDNICERLVAVANRNVEPGRWRVVTHKSMQSAFRKEAKRRKISTDKDNGQREMEINANKDRYTSTTSESVQANVLPGSDGVIADNTSVLSLKEKDAFAKAIRVNRSSGSLTANPTVFDIWDFGGQFVFYATHTMFHSKRAIYLVVFDLSLALNKPVTVTDFPSESSDNDMEYFLRFWMNSIHSFVGSEDGLEPKVILVGTHKDKIEGNAEMKQKYINKYFDDVRKLFDSTVILKHIHPDDFAVNNNDTMDEAIMELRETIANVGKDVTKNVMIPAKWIQLEKSLRTLVCMKVISLQQLLDNDAKNEMPLGEVEQVKLFLQYHHGKGTFVYFDEEPISEFVVLDPQYLIDAFKSIITCERFCTNDTDLRPLWQLLQRDGRLEKRLIDRQWGKSEDKYIQHKDILLAFLTKHHIISEAASYDETTHASTGLGWYVVPSLMRDNTQNTDVIPFLQGKKQTKLRIVIWFVNSPIVQTVYHRLIAAAIGKWPIAETGNQVLLFKDLCIVRLNSDHVGIAEMKLDCIELRVVNLCSAQDVDSEQADKFRRFSESVISHEFRKLRSKSEDCAKPYTIMFRCNHEWHDAKGSNKILPIDELVDDKIIPCPDLLQHDICVNTAKTEWFQDSRKSMVCPSIQLNDKLMSRLSQCIGSSWQLLGYELGLTHVEIDHITDDHSHSAPVRIYYMLRLWHNKMSDSGTLDKLVQAMEQCQKVTIEWDKIRNIVDDEVSSLHLMKPN